ncbi:Arc family DNA-binding protein [Escherichia coli]
MSKRDDPQLRVRIPPELKNKLEEKARLNKRTLTAEIVDRLEATLLQDSCVESNTGYQDMASGFEEGWRQASEWQEKYTLEYGLVWADAHKDELRDAVEKLHNVLNKKK